MAIKCHVYDVLISILRYSVDIQNNDWNELGFLPEINIILKQKYPFLFWCGNRALTMYVPFRFIVLDKT